MYQQAPIRSLHLIPGVLHLHRFHTHALNLWPYRVRCLGSYINDALGAVPRRSRTLPTGAGKTVVFVSLPERLQAFAGDSQTTPSLVIVKGVGLARQAADQARKLFPHWIIEIGLGARYAASGLADKQCVAFFLV